MADSNGKYSTLKVGVQANPHHRMEFPDGAWVKCKQCGRTLYKDQLAENLYVCTYCACHLAMSLTGRIRLLTDAGSFQEIDKDLISVDSLGFVDSKPYTARIAENKKMMRSFAAVPLWKAAAICSE